MSTLTELETVIFDIQANIDVIKNAHYQMKRISDSLIDKRNCIAALKELNCEFVPIEACGNGFSVPREEFIAFLEKAALDSVANANEYLADFKAAIHDKS